MKRIRPTLRRRHVSLPVDTLSNRTFDFAPLLCDQLNHKLGGAAGKTPRPNGNPGHQDGSATRVGGWEGFRYGIRCLRCFSVFFRRPLPRRQQVIAASCGTDNLPLNQSEMYVPPTRQAGLLEPIPNSFIDTPTDRILGQSLFVSSAGLKTLR